MANKAPQPIYSLRGHNATVNHLNFHPQDADCIVSGGADGKINIWKLSIRRPRCTIDNAHTGETGVLSCEFFDEDKILSQGRDGCLKIWDVSSPKEPLHTLEIVDEYSFCKLSLLPVQNAPLIAIAREEPSQIIELWDINKNEKTLSIDDSEVKKGMCMCLKLVQPPGKDEIFLAVGYEDGGVYIYSTKTGKQLCSLRMHKDPPLCVTMNPECNFGVCGSAGPGICAFTVNLSEGTLQSNENEQQTQQSSMQLANTFTINNGGISAVKIRKDEKIFASVGWDHRVRVFDKKKLKPLAILKDHTESLFALDFCPSNNLLAAAGKDKKISIWSLY